MADQEGRRETIQESPIIKSKPYSPTQDGELHLKRKAPPPIGGIARDDGVEEPRHIGRAHTLIFDYLCRGTY